MTTKLNIYKMNVQLKARYKKNNRDKCRVCKKEINVGDMVVSKFVAHRGNNAGIRRYEGMNLTRRVLYCVDCAYEKNIIVEKVVIK
jgi:hypothetical protein